VHVSASRAEFIVGRIERSEALALLGLPDVRHKPRSFGRRDKIPGQVNLSLGRKLRYLAATTPIGA
jgi:hypothetical protein